MSLSVFKVSYFMVNKEFQTNKLMSQNQQDHFSWTFRPILDQALG